MKSAVIAGIALSAHWATAENILPIAPAQPGATSTVLTNPGTQADCTVIKAAYRQAHCDCEEGAPPGVLRRLEDKLSIRVTIPKESTDVHISAGSLVPASPLDIVAPSQTSWNFWMVYDWNVNSQLTEGDPGYGVPVNKVNLIRMGSAAGARVMYARGDRYHLDYFRNKNQTNTPVMPSLAEAFDAPFGLKTNGEVQTPTGTFVANQNEQWVHVSREELGLALMPPEFTAESYLFYRSFPTLEAFGLDGQLLRCDGYGTTMIDRAMGGTCEMYGYSSSFGFAQIFWRYKQYPFNFVRDIDHNCRKGVTPFKGSAGDAKLVVTTPTEQPITVYCPAGESCGAVPCASQTDLDDYVDITAADVPWSQYPKRGRYDLAVQNWFATITEDDGLPDPALQNTHKVPLNLL